MLSADVPRIGTTFAFMLGTEEPPLAIVCDPAGDSPGISWFSVVISDAPPLDESPDVQPLCGHRLIEEFPELGRGLDLTLESGEASSGTASGDRRPIRPIWSRRDRGTDQRKWTSAAADSSAGATSGAPSGLRRVWL